MKNVRNLILVILSLGCASGVLAQGDSKPASQYFYSIPQTETDSGEWVFKVSDCAVLPKEKSKTLEKNCQAESDRKICKTRETAEAENADSHKKMKFPKVLLVFDSETKCKEDRDRYLKDGY